MVFIPLHDRNTFRHIRFAYVTYALIGLSTLIYLVQFFLPPDLFDQVALQFGMIPDAVRQGATVPGGAPWPWTLVTYAFLHGSWLHLLFNMLFLWIFGDNIEDALGHVRYLLFYLICAVAAALAHLMIFSGATGPLIGASGAVAGVMGGYVVLYPHARVLVLAKIIIPIPLPIPAFWMLGVWAATQLFYAFFATGEPIAWWAHVGGVIVGGVLVVMMKRRDVPLFDGR